MTIQDNYYVADCESNQIPVSHKDVNTFYMPINVVKTEEGLYCYEEYRFNIPVNYALPAEVIEYMAETIDEYRLALKEVGVI